jgi:AcrR family transcriptional regulator
MEECSMRVKKEAKREEIMLVAREVFREKGYAETSMAEISARLGGSKGTLYNYFASKEELFITVMLEIVDRHATGLLSELERAEDMRAGLAPFMYQLMRALCSAEMVDFRRMLIGEAGRTPLGLLVHQQGPGQYLKKFGELFAAQMKKGRFRKVDPWQAAVHMQGLCTGIPVQWVLEGVVETPGDDELAVAAAAAADVFFRAYATEPVTVRKPRVDASPNPRAAPAQSPLAPKSPSRAKR